MYSFAFFPSSLLGYYLQSEKAVVVKLKGTPFNTSIIVYMHRQHNLRKKKWKSFAVQRQGSMQITGYYMRRERPECQSNERGEKNGSNG